VDEPSRADRIPIESSGRTASVPAIITPVTKAEILKNFDNFRSLFMASSAPYTTIAIPAIRTSSVYHAMKIENN
jgi:hypothetical protein